MSFDSRCQKLEEIARRAAAADPAHDFSHSKRVLINALKIAEKEGGDTEVLAAAAYLHDIANLPKNHPDSHLSSERSADRAEQIARELGFADDAIVRLKDAVLCHSYSRGLTPSTLEGRVFQDADRLDAIGAIGIARTFTVGGALDRPMYDPLDPFLESGRAANDKENTLDHFFVKLFHLSDRMQTVTGQELAGERTARMKRFLADLADEIAGC